MFASITCSQFQEIDLLFSFAKSSIFAYQKIAHRFWGFQIVLTSLPTMIYVVISAHLKALVSKMYAVTKLTVSQTLLSIFILIKKSVWVQQKFYFLRPILADVRVFGAPLYFRIHINVLRGRSRFR